MSYGSYKNEVQMFGTVIKNYFYISKFLRMIGK